MVIATPDVPQHEDAEGETTPPTQTAPQTDPRRARTSRTIFRRFLRTYYWLHIVFTVFLCTSYSVYIFKSSIRLQDSPMETYSTTVLTLPCQPLRFVFTDIPQGLLDFPTKDPVTQYKATKIDCAEVSEQGEVRENGLCFKQAIRYQVLNQTGRIRRGPCGQELFGVSENLIDMFREYKYQCNYRKSKEGFIQLQEVKITARFPRIMKKYFFSLFKAPYEEDPDYLKCLVHTFFGDAD